MTHIKSVGAAVRHTLFFICIIVASTPALAHDSSSYSYDKKRKINLSSWMETLKSGTRVNMLSLPGTHDSAAIDVGLNDLVRTHYAQTQRLSIRDQLMSGIRVFDIRCVHKDRRCKVHHGKVETAETLDSVLGTTEDFLDDFPTEAVFVRIKHPEHEDSDGGNRGQDFSTTFEDRYLENHPRIWREADWSSDSGAANYKQNPQLSAVRGRIVILQDFGEGSKFGIRYSSLETQDDYKLQGDWDLYSKWKKVKSHFYETTLPKNQKNGKIYLNYLSGSASGSAFPYPWFVASGHTARGTSKPRRATGRFTLADKSKGGYDDFPRLNCLGEACTISFEGTNELMMDTLFRFDKLRPALKRGVTFPGMWDSVEPMQMDHLRAGMVMADFPGPGLILSVVMMNRSLMRASRRDMAWLADLNPILKTIMPGR